MSFHRITSNERNRIYALSQAGISDEEMGFCLGYARSSIKREFARNGGRQGLLSRSRTGTGAGVREASRSVNVYGADEGRSSQEAFKQGRLFVAVKAFTSTPWPRRVRI